MARIEINVEARPHEIVEDIWLGSDGPYIFTTPKSAPIMSALRKVGLGSDELEQNMNTLGLVRSQYDWLKQGFGKEVWTHFEERLADDEDPLDDRHITLLFESLFAQVGGERPPTSSGGSSTSPPVVRQLAAPKRVGSTAGKRR